MPKVITMLCISAFFFACSQAKTPAGMKFSKKTGTVKHSIPLKDIKSGGPAKDGIPSIDNPIFISVNEVAKFMKDNDFGIGVSFNKVHRFYPNRIIVWHEIVNDVIGGQAVLVTYCPLCGTGIVYNSKIKGKRVEFGTSGKLWNSNLLMYDRQTDSLWSQVKGEAVVGEMTGYKLQILPHQNIEWKHWKEKYPDGEVLSGKTGYNRNYNTGPYGGYHSDKRIFFPVDNKDDRFHPKTPTYAITIDNLSRIYPISELEKSPSKFKDKLSGVFLSIHFNKKDKTIKIKRLDNKKEIVPVYGYWFSWMAVYPRSKVYIYKK